jgi:serine/threonine-protein kinase RsbW
MRRALRRWLAESDVDEEIAETMLLVTDEAVTNAVEHAARERPCTVEVLAGPGCDGGIAVTVRDDGRWVPPSAPGYRGRGITLIERLTDRSSVTTSPTGTTVRMCWFTPPAR